MATRGLEAALPATSIRAEIERHVTVRGSKITLQFRGKNKIWVRLAVVDAELAGAIRELLTLPGGRRLFRYEWEGDLHNLTGKRLNDIHAQSHEPPTSVLR